MRIVTCRAIIRKVHYYYRWSISCMSECVGNAHVALVTSFFSRGDEIPKCDCLNEPHLFLSWISLWALVIIAFPVRLLCFRSVRMRNGGIYSAFDPLCSHWSSLGCNLITTLKINFNPNFWGDILVIIVLNRNHLLSGYY